MAPGCALHCLCSLIEETFCLLMQSLDGQCFCCQVQFRIWAPESALPAQCVPPFTALVGPSQLQVLKGEEDLHTVSWGEGSSWQECRRCRTRLFYRRPPGNEVYVQLGAIRDRFRGLNLQLPDWLPVGPAQGRLVKQFHRAAQSGRFAKVRRLLALGVPVDAEVEGQTALEHASHQGRLRICRLLLSQGADVRRALRHAYLRLPVDRVRPLFRLLLGYGYPAQELVLPAIDAGAVGALALLLKESVDGNQPDDRGKTLLERAAPSSAMIRLLLGHGADVTLVGRSGTHALGWCAYWGLSRPVKILLEGGFPPDLAEHEMPGSALRYACSRGHVEVVRLLLQFGADPNLAGAGSSPLILACRQGSLAIVEMLLAAGADPQARDRRGRSALDCALSALPDLLSMAVSRPGREVAR